MIQRNSDPNKETIDDLLGLPSRPNKDPNRYIIEEVTFGPGKKVQHKVYSAGDTVNAKPGDIIYVNDSQEFVEALNEISLRTYTFDRSYTGNGDVPIVARTRTIRAGKLATDQEMSETTILLRPNRRNYENIKRHLIDKGLKPNIN